MLWNMMNSYGWMGWMGGYMIAVLLIALIIYIWALVDILQARRESEWKILWLLVLVLVPVIGFFLYLIIGRSEKRRRR